MHIVWLVGQPPPVLEEEALDVLEVVVLELDVVMLPLEVAVVPLEVAPPFPELALDDVAGPPLVVEPDAVIPPDPVDPLVPPAPSPKSPSMPRMALQPPARATNAANTSGEV